MSTTVYWIVDLDVSFEDAQAFGMKGRDWLVARGIVSSTPCSLPAYGGNEILLPGIRGSEWGADEDPHGIYGLELAVGRTVFHSGGNGIDELGCPRCGRRHDPDAVAWSDAVGAWYSAEGSDCLRCPSCGESSSIVDWHFLECAWGFGNLGFGFWNWPIKPSLADEMAGFLGHRCRYVCNRI